MIKNFVLKAGRFLIDFNSILELILLIIITIICSTFAFNILKEYFLYGPLSKFGEYSILIAIALYIIPIILLIFFVLTNYLLYLFIDIRDNLEEIKKEKEVNN